MAEAANDFESFVPEVGGKLESIDCVKNIGHENFKPVLEFKLDDLPEEYQDDATLDRIRTWAQLTVKVLVKYVSNDRPDRYADSTAEFPNHKFRRSKRKTTPGSGYIYSITPDCDVDKTKDCSCFQCQKSGEPKKECWYFTVLTAIHVVFDSSEAERSILECFYDSDETRDETAECLYGLSMYPQIGRNNEKMSFVICVTHDKSPGQKLEELIRKREEMVNNSNGVPTGLAVLISHPHGCSKTISVGCALHLTVPTGHDYLVNQPIPFEEETECILPYGLLSKDSMEDLMQAHGLDTSGLNTATTSDPVISDCIPGDDFSDMNNSSINKAISCAPQEGLNSDPTLSLSTTSSTTEININTECEYKEHADASSISDSNATRGSSSTLSLPGSDAAHIYSFCLETSDNNTEKKGPTDEAVNSTEAAANTESSIVQPDDTIPSRLDISNKTDNDCRGNNVNSAEKDYSTDSNISLLRIDSTETDSCSIEAEDVNTDGKTDTDKDAHPTNSTTLSFREQGTSRTADTEIKAGILESSDNVDIESFNFCCVDEFAVESPEVLIPPPDHLVSFALPPKTTFTIPEGAAFARRYDNLKALFTLPPDTKFHLANGKEVQIPPEAVFYCNRVSLQQGYIRYRVDSCPGSSGGCLMLDEGQSFFNTIPHGGSLADGVSMCAMRCFPVMPSAV